MKLSHYTFLLFALSLIHSLHAAVVLNAGSTYIENFDSMGVGTTLPSNWQITFDDEFTYPPNTLSGTSNSVMFQASNGTPTTPGTYNFGRFGDRAVGAIPNMIYYPGWGTGDESSLLILQLYINDPTITGLEITFDLETYYIEDSLESQILGLWSSSQVATDWNHVTAASDPSYTAGHYFNAPPTVPTSATLSASDFETGDLYLIFQFNGVGRSGIALDNFSITAIPEPGTLNLLLVCSYLLLFTRRRKSM